jgi:hypothetical protein
MEEIRVYVGQTMDQKCIKTSSESFHYHVCVYIPLFHVVNGITN